MKRKLATIYAVFCTLLLVAGFLLVFYFAFNEGVTTTVKCLVGLALGFILSPILHELGHVLFGLIAKMDYVYVKCFCFKIYLKNGKKRLGFASPFSADETQVLPIKGGNMEKRAALYTLGGLIYGGCFLAIILAAVILTACLGNPSYKMLGMLPYAAYLFFLNLPPFEYVGGKTDGLIYKGIKKGYDAEKCMLSVMEIQGQLSEGKSFSEIDEKYYFDLPQLCEDEPLYAVILDLRYRYYLEKGNFEKAADCLNRLALNEEYLSVGEIEKIAAELVYMHALNGDLKSAEINYTASKNFLKEETVTAKRIVATYAKACGKEEAVQILLEQAQALLEKEKIVGVRKFEEILLLRLSEE